ncbi:hypothetical protein [Curvibacter fontanus]
MTPTFYSKAAERLFPIRWWFLALAIAAMVVIVATVSFSGSKGIAAFALAGPLVGLPWAVLCACIWFHPERGNMRPSSKLIGWLPPVIQSGIRWYAALFLTLFAAVCGVVWPLFTLSAL